jgi:predicted  nucleic acid-binding Zn-ribbon protein
MRTLFYRLIFAFILSGLTAGLARADESSDLQARLRQTLRDTAHKLSDAQSQIVVLQAAKDQADHQNADLQAKIDGLNAQVAALEKQSADDKAASDQALADLQARLADASGQIDRLNQAVAAWKDAYSQASQLATEKEAARARLDLATALLQRTVDDRETKNLQLYKTACEILSRYEKYALGEALSAKEPFAGISRAKLEELVQGYKDKLLHQTVIAGQPPDPPTLAAASLPGPAAPAGSTSPPPINTPGP